MTVRQWIAWKLVRLSHRIYDTTFYEHIVITDEHGQVGEFVIVADAYHGGVSSYSSPDPRGAYPDLYEFGCCNVIWEEVSASPNC